MDVINLIASGADKLGFYYLTVLCFSGAFAYAGKMSRTTLKNISLSIAFLGLFTLLVNDFFGDGSANHLVLVLAAASMFMFSKQPLQSNK